MDSDTIVDEENYSSDKPNWRRKDRVPATHHSKEKKGGRGSAKNQLHKLFKREYLVKADIKRSADKFGKWVDERQQGDMKVGEAAEEGEESEVESGAAGDEIVEAEEGDRIIDEGAVWDEEMMKALEGEDRAAWDAILRQRGGKEAGSS